MSPIISLFTVEILGPIRRAPTGSDRLPSGARQHVHFPILCVETDEAAETDHSSATLSFAVARNPPMREWDGGWRGGGGGGGGGGGAVRWAAAGQESA